MAGPARAGVLIYAKDLARVAGFYQSLLDMRPHVADAEHCVLENADVQLVIHVIPAQFAADIQVSVPPEPRQEQAIKPFFTVASLRTASDVATAAGGFVFGPVWDGPGFLVRNACDPEGNILQLREFTQ